MRKIQTILLFFTLLTKVTVSAQEEETKTPLFELRGYIKDLHGVSFLDNIDSLSSVNILHNRLNLKINCSPRLSARIEVRNRVFWGDQVRKIPGFGQHINRYNGIVDLSHSWVSKPSFVVHSVIDRLLLQYQTGKWDIKLGRQRINWGINTVWNPNDIFNAYDLLDFDYEERPGNDALRIQYSIKDNTTLEVAVKPGHRKNETIAALLYKFNRKNTDWQLLGGLFRQDWAAGAGWASNVRKAGFKGEISYFHPRKNIVDTCGIISASVMADQTFPNDWYFAIAALYNSKPSGLQAFGGSIYGSDLSAKQLFPYRYSFYTGIMKTFSPAISVNVSLIFATEKNTLVIFPGCTWNAAANLDLDLLAQSFFSRQDQRYRTLGTTIFLRTKFSF